ncbi:acyl-CoA/acyl-ACP dehydrogenase [Bradyrhizobium sp. 190]|uniref:acyl-CoA dehydrogenase family protein n=1 Tax=Bradyrhizobium sp. 190 TaxID=2782658 RepID=UPI001FFC13EC|nr:acyl-CoA dehydrogenase family protein [Bradyrhizobium sp. 190]MCK1513207.1 acyl-CoA/acyl-ACP dehydrogenase [Bradyrhizobium sp. 190]
MSDDMRDMLHESALRIFADNPPDLWAVLQGAGFDKALLAESKGGAGVSWADACGLLGLAGEHAAAVPLAEAMVGHWLAERAGVEDATLPTIAFSTHPEQIRLARARDGWRVDGTLPRVPWGRTCTHVAFILGPGTTAQLVVLARDAAGVSVTPGHNLAGEPRDTLLLDGVVPQAVVPAPFDAGALLAVGAIVRSALMAGAIERALGLAVEYANLRVQFGRPIGKFQAVQQNIAVLATQAAAARVAAEAGTEAIDDWLAGKGEPLTQSIAAASAKIRTGEAAGQACAISHQVFGAIGFTEEHDLHRFTKRLWSWRDECGNEAYWSLALGERILAGDTKQTLWRTLAPAASGAATGVAK